MSKNKESSKSGISPTRKHSLHIRVSCIENMKNDITNVWGMWLDYYQSSYFTLEYVLLYLSLFPVHCLFGVYCDLQDYKEHSWVLFNAMSTFVFKL